jgi:hypothetical protein
MPSAHAAVKHELLVRHLDAWTPAALHGHKRVTYIEVSSGESAVAAARVFGEFADLLDGHALVMVVPSWVAGTVSAIFPEYGSPSGLSVEGFGGDVVAALRDAHAMGAPIFAWFDGPVPADVLSTVAANRSSEVFLAGPGPLGVEVLRSAGLNQTALVELVDAGDVTESLGFATSSEKALEKFKDELWALDEYAGIRYRDPADGEHTLLDISLQPNLRPLRRALNARVRVVGEASLTDLRTWVVHETIYRTADATKAVQALVAAGEVGRSPAGGRLSPSTIIHSLSRRPAAEAS